MRPIPSLLFSIAAPVLFAQVSPFNDIPFEPRESGVHRIIISGHLHGASNDRSGFPAGTLLANIDRINALDADLFLSTGDLFLDAGADHDRYAWSFFSKLEVPLFNAPGNHDKGAFYDRNFGPSHRMIALGDDRIVLLDTEVADGTLGSDQLAMLEQLLDPAPPRIFIISHRPLWAENDDRYGPLFEGNTRSFIGNNYKKDVEPLLQRLAERSEIFWASGSMAGNAPSSIFFQPHAPNITFIQSAIRNEKRDAILIADVSPTAIKWSAISLTGQQLEAPEKYDAEFWGVKRAKKEPFNWRLLPYLIKITVSDRAFWYGFGVAVLLLIGLRAALRRWL